MGIVCATNQVNCFVAHLCAHEHGAIGRAPQPDCSNRLFVPLLCCPNRLSHGGSDNYAAAATDLRRLAALDEATLRGALAYMGREPFRRLRRAVGCTPTPEPSDDEGGSGPAGAQASSSPYRLDPAVNAENQVTASWEANVNNLDPALGDSFLAAVSSPTASMATQDPVWPPASGGPTSLESYLGEQLDGWTDLYVSHGAYYLGCG